MRKEKMAFDESTAFHESSEFEKRPTTQKGNDGEGLLVKAKKIKLKKNRTLDESMGAISELEMEPKNQKEKAGVRLLPKTKKSKMKEKLASDESIAFHEPPEYENRPASQKGNDGKGLPVKSKQRKLKKKKVLAESIGTHDSLSELKIEPKIQKAGVRMFPKTKKRKIKEKIASDESIAPPEYENMPASDKGNDGKGLPVKAKKKKLKKIKVLAESIGTHDSLSELKIEPKIQKVLIGKLIKNCKRKKENLTYDKEISIEEDKIAVDEDTVYEISSVDDDCSKGMKKWLKQYRESRPGLEVLQQRIDEFVTAHEEQQDQERKEREARAAEDGWTVVLHHKGRKKTTDADTGTAVGSVASAAVIDKMSKQKGKETAQDFYRFQKREAKMNELMMLQSKFEQDKKRIQQLRAARKFRPY